MFKIISQVPERCVRELYFPKVSAGKDGKGNKRQYMVLHGFTHGFLVISNYAEFAYKCDAIYIRRLKEALHGMIRQLVSIG